MKRFRWPVIGVIAAVLVATHIPEFSGRHFRELRDTVKGDVMRQIDFSCSQQTCGLVVMISSF